MLFNLIYFLIGVIFAFIVLIKPDNFLKLFLVSIVIGPGIKISGLIYGLLDFLDNKSSSFFYIIKIRNLILNIFKN